MIHPLVFTILYSVVLSSLFDQEFKDYSVYVFSGFVLWNAISAFANLGAVSFVNASGYLKQAAIPLMVFPFRVSLSIMLVYSIELVSLALYTLVVIYGFGSSAVVSWTWVWVLPIGAAMFLIGVPIATLTGFLNVQFRDTQQLLVILTQALWFASPVFFARDLFEAPILKMWSAINPVAAFCDVSRAALIYGQTPAMHSWITIGGWVLGLWIVALVVLRMQSRRIIMLL